MAFKNEINAIMEQGRSGVQQTQREALVQDLHIVIFARIDVVLGICGVDIDVPEAVFGVLVGDRETCLVAEGAVASLGLPCHSVECGVDFLQGEKHCGWSFGIEDHLGWGRGEMGDSRLDIKVFILSIWRLTVGLDWEVRQTRLCY